VRALSDQQFEKGKEKTYGLFKPKPTGSGDGLISSNKRERGKKQVATLSQHARKREKTNDTQWLDSLLLDSCGYTIPVPEEGFRTRVAVRAEQLQGAEQLVRRRYAWRGYQTSAAHITQSVDSERRRVTLLAEDRGRLVGTLTVRPDSPQGLLAELTYGSEIEGLRGQGHRLGEVVKLAVEEGAHSRAALDTLVHSAYLISHKAYGRSHVVIEVNPRHVRFYEKAIGFVVAAAESICARVGAPSVLMELDLEQFGRRLQAAAARARPALKVVA
jgi:hypothetical protein